MTQLKKKIDYRKLARNISTIVPRAHNQTKTISPTCLSEFQIYIYPALETRATGRENGLSNPIDLPIQSVV